MTHAFSAEDLAGHAAFLQRMAQALVGEAEGARDATQDTFVAALEHPPARSTGLRPWLATVLRNQVRNRHRRELARTAREREVARAEPIEGGQGIVERIELQRLVCAAVLALEEPRREAIFLRYYEGLSPGAIAARRGESVKTVKSRLNRALEELRQRLDAHTDGERRLWAAALVPLARRAPGVGSLVRALRAPLVAAAGVALLATLAWRMSSGRGDPVAPASPSSVPLMGVANVAATPALPGARTNREPVSSAAPAGSLEVHLRWETDSQPAAGVGLDAWAENDPAPRESRRRTTTDSGGIARFDGLAPGAVELRLDRTTAFAAEAVAGETRTLEFSVPAGWDVAGRVLSSTGETIAGAELWVEDLFARLPDPWPVGRSAADGTFRLRSLGPRQRILARSPAHVTASSVKLFELQADEHGLRTVELTLEEGGQSLAGRVLDPEGRAVAGACVWIGSNSRDMHQTASGRLVEGAGSARAETDAEGRFTAPSLVTPGDQALVVLADGFPCWHGEVEVGEDAPAAIEVRLPAATAIEGVVTDAQGRFVAGARVKATSASGDRFEAPGTMVYFEALTLPGLRARSDADGSFTLGWVVPQAYALEAEDPEHPELGRARLVVGSAGAEDVVLLQLDPEPRLTGRVVDSGGAALPGWLVQAVPDPYGRALRDTHTDATGAFAFHGLEPGAYRVVATAPGTGVQPTVETRAEAGAAGLELVLEGPSATARLSGRLMEHDGSVPRDTRLLAQSLRTGLAALLSVDARTGRFEYGPLEAGRWRLKAQRGERVVALGEPVELLPDAITDAGLLTIPAPGSIAVRFAVDESAPVVPRLERPGFGSARLASEGERFVARELAPGTWWLKASSAGRFTPDRVVEIRSGEEAELELVLQPCATFPLRIEREEGPYPSALVLEIRDEAGALLCRMQRDFGVREVTSGSWSLPLPLGPIALEAWTEEGRRGLGTAVVGEPAGAPYVLTVR